MKKILVVTAICFSLFSQANNKKQNQKVDFVKAESMTVYCKYNNYVTQVPEGATLEQRLKIANAICDADKPEVIGD